MHQNRILIYAMIFLVAIGMISCYRFREMRKRRGGYFEKRASEASGWSKWSRWDCPVTCGGGIAERSRICVNQGPCEGPRLEKKKCADIPCPIGAPQYLIDQAKTQLETNTKGYQLQKGEELHLNCQGRLQDTISSIYRKAKGVWYHNQELFHPQQGRVGVMDTFNLYFAKVLPKDNGVWSCQVRLDEKSPLFTAVYTMAVENDVPDIEIKDGDPLTLPCKNMGLTNFFTSKMVTQWFHNATLFEDEVPEDAEELSIEASQPADSGIWTCKVTERDRGLGRPPKEWATNVIRVKVLSSAAAALKKAGRGKSSATAVIIILILVAAAGLALFYFLRVRKSKKSKTGKSIDVEKGMSKKSPFKGGIKLPGGKKVQKMFGKSMDKSKTKKHSKKDQKKDQKGKTKMASKSDTDVSTKKDKKGKRKKDRVWDSEDESPSKEKVHSKEDLFETADRFGIKGKQKEKKKDKKRKKKPKK